MRKAVVLLSGGLDSATTLAIAQRDGFDAHAISFSYGQRHAIELTCAKRVAANANVARHLIVPVDLRLIGGSALTSEVPVPKNRPESEFAGEIPITYVPARNTIFLSLALGWAEVLHSVDIFIGVNALDYSGYPDCRPEFINAFEQMANLATKAAVEGRRLTIHAPLIQMTKAEIIRAGLALGVDFSLSCSCYDPTDDGHACGTCDACALRQRGFEANGLEDPALYRTS
jgi:7-cyano-7-deazaguanine synthase